jgi:murein DD-endopeptidase MepM/ murein hydrolase activator NlpD
MQVNTAIKQEIQKRSDLIDRDPEFLRLQAQLASYKLLDPKQRAAQAKVASGRVQQVLTRINQTLEQQQARSKANPMPQQRPGGVSPEYPFKLPQLELQTIRGNKIITPFKPGTRGVVSSDYKDPRPGRLHAGIDIAVPIGTPLIFYDHGVVDYVGNVSGYGKMVDIKTPDGKIHRFAHLDSYKVKKGDKVTPGSFFARSGNTDGGTGISTGPHLHWEVRNSPHGGFESSVDIVKHMVQYRNGSGRMVRNSQKQPTHVPLDSVRGSAGSYIRTGKVHTADGNMYNVRYSLGAPFKQDYMSPYIGDYRRANKATANYGYKQLADDPAFAKKIAQVASKIGIPAVWLVDIMAHESAGFQTAISNDKTMATGLIQFMPETAASLGTSVAALKNMDKLRQLDYVEKYFRVNGFSKRMKNIYAVLQAIWNGSIDRANRLDPSLISLHDQTVITDPETGERRYFNFGDYVKRLGRDVGRKYKPYGRKGTAIHVGYRSGCPTCQSIQRSGEAFFPHEAG